MHRHILPVAGSKGIAQTISYSSISGVKTGHTSVLDVVGWKYQLHVKNTHCEDLGLGTIPALDTAVGAACFK